MAVKHSVHAFSTLKECLEFLQWLHTQKGVQGQLASRLRRLLEKMYKGVSQISTESALSTFLNQVSTFHNKLCIKPHGMYTGLKTAKNALNALLDCVPKVLSVMNFLRYQVDVNFKALGGGSWAEQDVGVVAMYARLGSHMVTKYMSTVGDIDRYLIASVADNKYSVIPGGFAADELKQGYDPRQGRGYASGSDMLTDVKNILEKETNKNNLFRDVFCTTVLSGSSGTNTENIANAVRLVEDFCRMFETVTKDNEFKQHLQYNRMCIDWEALETHCAKLKDSLGKIFTSGRFSFTGFARSLGDLDKDNIAKKMASWLKKNLETMRMNLEKIKTFSSIRKSNRRSFQRGYDLSSPDKAALADYLSNHFIHYGFTFYGNQYNKNNAPYDLLRMDWDSGIGELKKAGGDLARLKEILDGNTCSQKEDEDEDEESEDEPPDDDLKLEEDPNAPKTEAAKPVTTKADGTPNQGKKSEGAQNQGKKAEGAQNQGKKSEGAQNQAKKAEGSSDQGNGQSDRKVANSASESRGASGPGRIQEPGGQAASSDSAQGSGDPSSDVPPPSQGVAGVGGGGGSGGPENSGKSNTCPDGTISSSYLGDGAICFSKSNDDEEIIWNAQRQSMLEDQYKNNAEALKRIKTLQHPNNPPKQSRHPPTRIPHSEHRAPGPSPQRTGSQPYRVRPRYEPGEMREMIRSEGNDPHELTGEALHTPKLFSTKELNILTGVDGTVEPDLLFRRYQDIQKFRDADKHWKDYNKLQEIKFSEEKSTVERESEEQKKSEVAEWKKRQKQGQRDQQYDKFSETLRRQNERNKKVAAELDKILKEGDPQKKKEADAERKYQEDLERTERQLLQHFHPDIMAKHPNAMVPPRSVTRGPYAFVGLDGATLDTDVIIADGEAIDDTSPNEEEKDRQKRLKDHDDRNALKLQVDQQLLLNMQNNEMIRYAKHEKDAEDKLRQGTEGFLRDGNILTATMQRLPTKPDYADAKNINEYVEKQRHSSKAAVTGDVIPASPPKPMPRNPKLLSILARSSLQSKDKVIKSARKTNVRPVTWKQSQQSDIIGNVINTSTLAKAQVRAANRRVKSKDFIASTNLSSQSAIIPGIVLDPIPLPSDTALKLHRQMETHKKFPMLDRLSQGKNGIPPPDMWIDRPRKVQRNTQIENIDNIAQGFFDPAPPPPSTWSEDTNTHVLSNQYPTPTWPDALEIDKAEDATHKIADLNIPTFNTDRCHNPWYDPTSSTSPTPADLSPLQATDHLPPPQTVREMLCWLVGLNQYGYIGFITENFECIFNDSNNNVSKLSDVIQVTGGPNQLTTSRVADKLTETCLYAAHVLFRIRYKGSSDAYETFFKDQDTYAFYYATDPSGLLCQLRDYVYACHYQLEFLKAQCSRYESHGGWQDCKYGSDITSPNSPLQSFLTDGWDSTFETHLFDPCNLCLKSRVRMGFKRGDLPKISKQGSVISAILTPSCGGDDPLVTLSSYLNCITKRTPRTTGELVSYFHHFGNELHGYDSESLSSLGTALSTSHPNCPEWDRLDGTCLNSVRGIRGTESLNFVSKTNSNHNKGHPPTLSTLVGCGSDATICHPRMSPITYRAYALYSQSFAHTYLSWAVHLPDLLRESLQKLYKDMIKYKCSDGKSLYSCSTALPLLYTHGITPPEVRSQLPLNCSDITAKLEKIVNGKPIVSLMTAMDNFLYNIREPFIFTIVALWSLALLIFANTMLYRIDILHIRSHLIRTKASHLIDVKALLSDNKKMMSLYDANYFDDDPNELLNLRY